MLSKEKRKIEKVKKRDGRIVGFDSSKIVNATSKAMEAAKEGNLDKDPSRIAERVVRELKKRYPPAHIPTVEEIQDLIEEMLIIMDFPKTAKAYILYRQERARIREKQRQVPDRVRKLAQESKKYFRNFLGEFIYYRSYSRWLEEEKRRETWIETVDRFIDFMEENLKDKLKKREYQEVGEAILNQEVMPSMRLMWSAGKAARATNVNVYNCSYIAPTKLTDFSEILYLLMCGSGVGFSVENQNIQQLPIIKHQTGKILPIYVIADSKEGWGDALTLGLKTWYKGKDIEFSYSKLRPAGARLRTMGGRSSGPEPLRSLLDFARKKVLDNQGRRLRPIDIHDIICKVGEMVMMGGVRRSALISLSDLEDEEMRRAKTGHYYITNSQRSMANNSVAYNEKPDAARFIEEWLALAKSGTGERGIFNRGGLKKQLPSRRWKKFKKYLQTSGTNPCVTSDTWIMTSNGAKKVRELINIPFEAIVNRKSYQSFGFFKTGKKEVFKVQTDRGFSFKATDNHKVLLVDYKSRKIQRNKWKKVKELRSGDKIILHNHKNIKWVGVGTEQEGWLLGNLLGDGNIEKNYKANLDYWGIGQFEMANQALALINNTVGARSDLVGYKTKTGLIRIGSAGLGNLAFSFGMRYRSKVITEDIEKSSSDFYEGFLQGWFDADGSVQGEQKKGVSIRLSSSSLSNLKAGQRMLARLGIISKVYKNRRDAGEKFLPDGRGGKKEYFCKAQHELIISKADILEFASRINFSDFEKREKLENLIQRYRRNLNREPFSSKVVNIISLGEEVVYDCNVPNINAFDGNGFYLHNCGEIVLRSKSFCNLTEVVARPEDTEQSLLKKVRIATILGTYQSTFTNFPYISKEWKKNCEEERLLGVSITGQWDCPAVRNQSTLEKLRKKALEVNQKYAKQFGINPGTAITSVKPSGTVSQLVDSSAGMHTRYAPYYIRRVRISAEDPLFHMLKEQKVSYHPEVGQTEASAGTYVLEFPIVAPKKSVFRKDLDAISQLEYWKMVKENYTEHNPSITILVKNNEWIKVANWLYENWDIIGGLTFLSKGEHIYQLAPYEEITKQRYEEVFSRFPEIDFSQILVYEKEDRTSKGPSGCDGPVCEISPGQKKLL